MEATLQELIMLLEILKFSTLQQMSLLPIQKIVVVLLKQLLATIKINGLQILDTNYYIFKTDFQDIPMIVFGNYLVSLHQIKQETIPYLLKIINHLAQWENKFYFKNDELIAQLGFTSNDLKEFGEKLFTPGIDMTLQNTSYNVRWKHNFNKYFDIVSGSQGMFQNNTNGQKQKKY